MKFASLLIAAAFVAAPAFAQDHAQHQGHGAAAQTAAAKFNLDTPIEKLVADVNAKAVLDSTMPGMTNHPHYEMFKAMSLKQLQPYSDGKITPELLTKAEAALAQVQ